MRRVPGPRHVVAASAAVALLATAQDGRAQVRWDASLQGGVNERILTSGAGSAGLGPIVDLKAHAALLPLVRIGAYAAYEVSPSSGERLRQIAAAGLDARVALPLLRGDWHSWAFLGAGYAGVRAPSYGTSLVDPITRATTPASVASGGGGFVEVPLGVGAAYRVRRPWELCVELGGKIGFLHNGSVYEGRTAVAPSGSLRVDPAGNDTWAIFLTVGVGIDR